MEIHNHSHARNRFAVLPTPVRLRIPPELAGKGTTIAFLDSGFYPHPDLTQPASRVIAHHDVTNPDASFSPETESQGWQWHGTQTSVVAAGNGFLSGGEYRGLACRANLVLVKVSEEGRISESNIARGLEWILRNRERFNIRIISISLGGDQDVPYRENEVDLLAEECVQRGMVVVVAAGNSGCTARHHTVPPANAPSVITVGGYDDGNNLESKELHLYCSSYGTTVDGILKPEIIAPAIWVAAPILPGTREYSRAEALSRILSAADYELPALAQQLAKSGAPFPGLNFDSPDELRRAAEEALKNQKIISTHYQHVDGTSFAAPITASVAALMLEANPTLSPGAIKQILISNAERIQGAPLARQGYGVLNARAAIEQAHREQHPISEDHFLPPRAEGDRIVFYYHDHDANSVSLAGDFNMWSPQQTPFSRDGDGIWRAEIQVRSPGMYQYKFVRNGDDWIEDPSNGRKIDDRYGGFNSVLIVTGVEERNTTTEENNS